MRVYLGETSSAKVLRLLEQYDIGRIYISRKPTPYNGERWAWDNGAYGSWKRGESLEHFEWKFQQRLHRDRHAGTPDFAVLPDRVGDPMSFHYSMSWLDRLPDWPWYLALQDGFEESWVWSVADRIDGLFLGGTDEYKATAPRWAEFAHAIGKSFHYARASTPGKLRLALRSGADSCDTAFPLWTMDRLYAFLYETRQGEMFPVAPEGRGRGE